MKLALELEAERVAPGGLVVGRIDVLEGGPSRSLTLNVGFHERTRDCTATPLLSTEVIHEGDLATGQTFGFNFTLLDDAPPSFETEHSQLWWELEAHSDEPGLDTRVSRRLEVVAEHERLLED